MNSSKYENLKNWITTASQKYKIINNEQRAIMKKFIFSQDMTDKEKEKIWNEIIRRSEILRR